MSDTEQSTGVNSANKKLTLIIDALDTAGFNVFGLRFEGQTLVVSLRPKRTPKPGDPEEGSEE